MFKRIFSGLFAAALLLSSLPVMAFADNDSSLKSLVLWYDFQDGLKDASGNDNDGENKGVEISGGKAAFDGKSSYIFSPRSTTLP